MTNASLESSMSASRCPCCFGREFTHASVLWGDLIDEWELAPNEADYIDRQQGTLCARCGCTLRSMVLARTLMGRSRLPFIAWVAARPWLRVLEMNTAAELTKFFRFSPRHTLAKFPDVDLMALPYADASFDLVIHSDTLEHVPDPVKALAECRRVLSKQGRLCYTVPIVVDRATRSRRGLAASYHGRNPERTYLVETEYGADAWKQPIEAGFSTCRIVTLEYPAAIGIEATV